MDGKVVGEVAGSTRPVLAAKGEDVAHSYWLLSSGRHYVEIRTRTGEVRFSEVVDLGAPTVIVPLADSARLCLVYENPPEAVVHGKVSHFGEVVNGTVLTVSRRHRWWKPTNPSTDPAMAALRAVACDARGASGEPVPFRDVLPPPPAP